MILQKILEVQQCNKITLRPFIELNEISVAIDHITLDMMYSNTPNNDNFNME